MICSLPPPLPDELLYSLLARLLGDLAGVTGNRMTTSLGIRVNTINLPCGLRAIARQIPWFFNMPEDRLISEHTNLPYFESTSSPERSASVRAAMLERAGPGSTTLDYDGKLRHGANLNGILRHCPLCLKEGPCSPKPVFRRGKGTLLAG